MHLDENESPILMRWYDVLAVALFVASGPRSVLPADEDRAAASWWEPITWLRANTLEPKRLQSRTILRCYPARGKAEAESYLFRFVDWDGAADRRRLASQGMNDLTLQARYVVAPQSEWERIEPSLLLLQRAALNAIESSMNEGCQWRRESAAAVDGVQASQKPIYKEFHHSSPYAAVTLNWSPGVGRRVAGDHWDAVWSLIDACEGIELAPGELIERYEIPPFGEYFDVAGDELPKVAEKFTRS